MDLRHVGAVDEQLPVVEKIQRLLQAHIDAQPRRGEIIVQRTMPDGGLVGNGDVRPLFVNAAKACVVAVEGWLGGRVGEVRARTFGRARSLRGGR